MFDGTFRAVDKYTDMSGLNNDNNDSINHYKCQIHGFRIKSIRIESKQGTDLHSQLFLYLNRIRNFQKEHEII